MAISEKLKVDGSLNENVLMDLLLAFIDYHGLPMAACRSILEYSSPPAKELQLQPALDKYYLTPYLREWLSAFEVIWDSEEPITSVAYRRAEPRGGKA
jgi:hypothetical protein